MKGLLKLTTDGWQLEDSSGEVVSSGVYPLIEDGEFIEDAAEALDHWKYHSTPYEKVDERY